MHVILCPLSVIVFRDLAKHALTYKQMLDDNTVHYVVTIVSNLSFTLMSCSCAVPPARCSACKTGTILLLSTCTPWPQHSYRLRNIIIHTEQLVFADDWQWSAWQLLCRICQHCTLPSLCAMKYQGMSSVAVGKVYFEQSNQSSRPACADCLVHTLTEMAYTQMLTSTICNRHFGNKINSPAYPPSSQHGSKGSL